MFQFHLLQVSHGINIFAMPVIPRWTGTVNKIVLEFSSITVFSISNSHLYCHYPVLKWTKRQVHIDGAVEAKWGAGTSEVIQQMPWESWEWKQSVLSCNALSFRNTPSLYGSFIFISSLQSYFCSANVHRNDSPHKNPQLQVLEPENPQLLKSWRFKERDWINPMCSCGTLQLFLMSLGITQILEMPQLIYRFQYLALQTVTV